MNNRLIRLAVAITVFSGHFTAHAYELGTHARMTYKAYEQSVLKKDDKLIKDLGIDLSNPNNPFGTAYYDVSGTEVSERGASTFEAGHMDDSENPYPVIPIGTDPRSLPGWLLRGAIREDDWTGIDIPGCRVIAENPQDDPYSNPPDRPKNHFYDPYYDRALTFLGVTLGEKAPDWATGAQDAFAPSPVPKNNRRNHFTVFDAREAMYRALTGKSKEGQAVAQTKDDRNKYWATLFRALGDIVHLVEDMGQPQHTRNDQHAGKFPEFLTGHASVYEKYLDCRATGGWIESIDSYQDYYLDACGALTYTGYLTPVFTQYADYFATRDGAGMGLAEYSNANLFTAGTNLIRSNA